jgi:hypothetical protein
MDPDFDLENEDIPVIEPSGLFSWWIRGMLITASIALYVAYKIFSS